MIENCKKTNNFITSKDTILIYNIERELGFIPTLKGTKLLNKAVQIVIKRNQEFIVLEDVYQEIASSYVEFNTVQIRNAIKYAIDTRDEKKAIANFEKIFGYPYDNYYFTNKTIIEEMARVISGNG